MADVLTADKELVYTSVPIMKWEDGPDGSVYVYGKATTPEVDTDEQICDSNWTAEALKSYMDAPALRVQHNALRDPAGSAIEVNINRDGDGAHWLKSVVDEPAAVRLVKKGHLRAYSIGISRPVIERDPRGMAKGGIIKGGKIMEVSLVDSPANRSCWLEMVKADKSGNAEWSGKVFGADDYLAGDGSGPDAETLEKAAKRFSPGDLAKILEIRARAEEREREELAKAAQPGADEEGGENAMEDAEEGDGDDAEAGTSGKASEPDATVLAEPGEVKAAEIAAYKRDIDTATRKRLADEGRALPNLSYPIETHEDAGNAVTLALSGHGDAGAAKSLIRRVAKEEGWQDILDRLDGGSDGESKAAKPKMRVPCPKCQAKCKPGAKFCTKCGSAMSADKSASPGDGVTGEHTLPVPAHREPDGTAMELLEDAAHLEGGNPDQGPEIAADARVRVPAAREAMTGKSSMDALLRHQQAGASWDDAVMHDLLCPAFNPDDVAKCYEGATVTLALDPADWQDKALEAAANAPIEKAAGFGNLWESALALKAAAPDDIADLTAEQHAAFLDANKALDAKPGPATFPVPTELSPARFHRPYISPGHAATPQPDGTHHVRVITGTPDASDFTRGPLTAGESADSPSNAHPASDAHVPAAGKPQRTYYRATAREKARHAMQVLHDHIAETHPDLCPMHGPGQGGMPPAGARPVPAVAGKAAGAGDAVIPATVPDEAAELAKAAAKPSMSKPPKVPCPSCGKKSKPTAMHCSGCGASMSAKKAAGPASAVSTTLPGDVQVTYAPAPGDPATIKAVVTEAVRTATVPLLKQVADLQELVDQMASDPDPRYAPFKGVAGGGVAPLLRKALAAQGQGPDTIEKAAQRQKAAFIAEMEQQIYSPDPAIAESAWLALNQAMNLAGAPGQR